MPVTRWLDSLLLGASLLLVPALASAHPGNGIVVDARGRVFFVATFRHAVMMIDRDGGSRQFVADERLRLPHHLVLTRDGSLYVASDYDGRVWRIADDGTLTEYFGPARIRGSKVSVGSWGDPFTIDTAGNIVALASPGDSSLVRIALDGQVRPITIRSPLSRMHARSIAVGPEGSLYVPSGNSVWRIGGDTAVRLVPRGGGILEGTGIAVDASGNIYVVDFYAGRVLRLAPDGKINTPPTLAAARFKAPTGVAVSSDGVVYVLNSPTEGLEVWRVDAKEASRVYVRRYGPAYAMGIGFSLLPLLLVIGQMRRKSPTAADWIIRSIVVSLVVVGLFVAAGHLFIFSALRFPILILLPVAIWLSRPPSMLRQRAAATSTGKRPGIV